MSGAPVRQPLPENDLPVTAVLEEASEKRESNLVFARLIWGNRGALARVALCALLASTIIAFLIPSRYQSTTRLMPPENRSNSGLGMAAAAAAGLSGMATGLGGIAGDLLGLKNTSDVFVGVLTSRTVRDRLIARFDLKTLYGTRNMEDSRKALAQHTDISIDRKSQIITIEVTDRNPKRAAAMGQAYVEELDRLVAELSTSSARRERIFLEERLQTVSNDLAEAEKNFSHFASQNIAIDVKEQGKAMVEAAAQLQGQLIAALSQYEGLKEIYTDNNPRLRSVKARIDELQRQLEKLGGKGESAMDVSTQPGESMYPSIRKLPLLGVTYADLYRRMKIQEVVLETLTKEYELAKVEEVREIPAVKVLDVAQIPDKISFPPRLAIVFLGTALALAAATTWISQKTAWNKMDVSDTRKVFAQEVFSTFAARVPLLSLNGSKRYQGNLKLLRHFWRREPGGSTSSDFGSRS